MDIIITVPKVNIEEFKTTIYYLNELNVNFYRFNLAKCESKEDLGNIYQKCSIIKDLNSNANIIFDLPYPNKNPRIFLKHKRLQVEKGVIISCDKLNLRDNAENYINVNDIKKHFIEGKNYYYQDGQGILKVVEINNDKILFKTKNNFEMCSGKALTSEKLIYDKLNIGTIDLINAIRPTQLWFSFVENIQFMKSQELQRLDYKPKFFMKIENKKGYNNLSEIIELDCGVIVARGDLGLNVEIEDLLDIQENIINYTKKKCRKVYIATDFLNSMKDKDIPNRSEVIDISTSIKMGCDGIMLNASAFFSEYIGNIIDFINKCESKYQ